MISSSLYFLNYYEPVTFGNTSNPSLSSYYDYIHVLATTQHPEPNITEFKQHIPEQPVTQNTHIHILDTYTEPTQFENHNPS